MFRGLSLDEFVRDDIDYRFESILSLKEDDTESENIFPHNRKDAAFTDEEKKIMQMLADGLCNDDIALQLNMPKPHLYYLRRKIKTKMAIIMSK